MAVIIAGLFMNWSMEDESSKVALLLFPIERRGGVVCKGLLEDRRSGRAIFLRRADMRERKKM